MALSWSPLRNWAESSITLKFICGSNLALRPAAMRRGFPPFSKAMVLCDRVFSILRWELLAGERRSSMC
jgi:hypothetical protein